MYFIGIRTYPKAHVKHITVGTYEGVGKGECRPRIREELR